MPLRTQTWLVLFALGAYYDHMDKVLQGKGLSIAISKVSFIHFLKEAGLAKKGNRALYQNLESLEKGRYITYDGQVLHLTKRGREKVKKMQGQMQPYLDIFSTVSKLPPGKYIRKGQTVFV
ncbi:hypothetical protein J4460_05285 [Candidatus Woesearchaeota archaeon]|nr:hypothetical protein [Candidatus Woesearchaeota archaeon]HIH38111.1 hypothetical protein [Candidatus Woesearchaeota archaeon]HIH49384.1 hypothetical protein [Candidatus Woesearchaeota archaeon]HIJ04370.1 hypothetical protein [Candidatus Woesearchaeota archaeon]